ncbi:ScyD/ScyE family protein [Granulicoccus sp. GXG6511]|uniref:ScyD/ScyE family protein n=1 Tax=Granulicoccus sp. GXG6511 TaxID=3381351 RepID=UPI003D7E89BA
MHRPTRLALAAATVAALAATLSPVQWAHAAPTQPDADGVIADGLHNPRQLSVGPGNRIYVAESGLGGEGPCQEGAEGPACFGLTGAITEIDGARQRQVVTGLPSIGATGPADVDVRGNNVAILLGLGGDTAFRSGFGEAARTLGTLQVGRLGGTLSTAADLAAYEQAHNPDGVPGPDSNPTGILAQDAHNWAVVDAGGNDLVQVGKRGERTIAVFPGDRTAPLPWDPNTRIPFQSVPTDVVKGPDGAYYVSELNGFPAPAGASTIYRVTRSGERSVYATGLTNVTSLDFRGNTLFAVQLSDAGFYSLPPGALPVGSVRRVIPGETAPAAGHPAVAENLTAPYGIAIRGNTAYVTTDVLGPAGKVREVGLR